MSRDESALQEAMADTVRSRPRSALPPPRPGCPLCGWRAQRARSRSLS